MSAQSDHSAGRVIPLCRTCRREATTVVAYKTGDALPFCPMCANDALLTSIARGDDDCREYPIEEFYEQAPGNVCQFDPHDSTEFEIYDPDNNETSWIFADNAERPGSSLEVEKYR